MSDLKFLPLTPERWDDFEKLFGPRGAVGGCWCMWWRMKRAEFERHQGNDNRLAMRAIVLSGEVPGILAYHADSAIGWCSVAPREAFPVLDRSPVLKRVDDQPVWSVVCFFIARGFRQQGVSEQLLRAALVYAQQEGAHIVEGYPIEPKKTTRRISMLLPELHPPSVRLVLRRLPGVPRLAQLCVIQLKQVVNE